ncbi:MAG: chloride channel protein [Bacteroidales bacterium]|uniref:chloride channel protein n=1 Tax=Candidatus Cryptobacteroides sp. TaxID=2952915 RepID=UPI002A7F90D5|nr:chloride channel protein [Candidatus Cryptobacteroides sp.]MDD7135189.1 chloride channel protein [Bacteroidales bacterium]MDY5043077.1 chloride channel protein [Candidatus Cryptobacteroides sp.]MDY5317423.1 chloride channel protein [Candidatus Cryptobacteroides sp.]MDY5565739.1 chloride channel protein [Candidatus Cryptobacteroides sp.]
MPKSGNMPKNERKKRPLGHSIRERLKRISEHNLLLIMSFVVGVLSGLAAVILKKLVEWIQEGLSDSFADSLGAAFYIVIPGIGMLLAMLFCRFVIKDGIGHGVTKVLQAVSKNESRIRPHNMWSSVAASSVTIGFGGSVGAEAPIVYTGAAIGSNFARYMGMSYRNMTILLGCGAAAAVAGIFKAPLAGVLFVLEILLFNISMTSMMPLLISTVSATVISYIFLGQDTPFQCTLTPFDLRNIPFYIILGLFCGGCSIYFIRTTLWLEDKIGRMKNPYLKWVLCAMGLGILIFLFPPLYGEGYGSLGALLNGTELSLDGQTPLAFMTDSVWAVPVFFLLILILKVFSMTLTNAGGGVGGTFGPTLFIGAIAGFVVARSFNLVLSGTSLTVPEQNFVLVGMAGLMAGVMQAPMTAIFLIAEISGGYDLFLPLILTATIAFGTTRVVEKFSIYTKRIAQKGELLTHDSDQAVLTLMKVSDVIEKDFSTVEIDAPFESLVKVVAESNRNIFPVLDSRNRFQGYVSLADIRKYMFRPELQKTTFVYNYMKSAEEYVYEDDKMDVVMKKFEITDAWNLPVVKQDRTYIGFVSKSKIFSVYRSELKMVSQD